jgi:hypothetical protein
MQDFRTEKGKLRGDTNKPMPTFEGSRAGRVRATIFRASELFKLTPFYGLNADHVSNGEGEDARAEYAAKLKNAIYDNVILLTRFVPSYFKLDFRDYDGDAERARETLIGYFKQLTPPIECTVSNGRLLFEVNPEEDHALQCFMKVLATKKEVLREYGR